MPKVVPEYKEDAKRRIVEAAMDVIAEHGCDGMTIDDVAKKIGVTKGAVYWYFASKEELHHCGFKCHPGRDPAGHLRIILQQTLRRDPGRNL